MMASVVEGQSPCSLAKNFWIVNSSGEFIECRPCPDCPEGLGLNIQCGSSITSHTKIECVQCKETKTYSDSHGVESCKPCQDCGRRNVLQECTSVQNRKCGRKCPKGYFFDGHITDCRETTPAIISTTTLSIVLIVIFTPPAVLCWMKFRMSKKTRPEHEDPARIPLSPLRVTENSPSCSLLDFKLADFPYDVEDFILQLDSDSSPVQKNWRHVAHRFEISRQDIQLLETESRKPGVSAIRLLIEKLCSFKCTTLKEFVEVLQELERNDVANDIISWFRQKQDRCSEEDKN